MDVTITPQTVPVILYTSRTIDIAPERAEAALVVAEAALTRASPARKGGFRIDVAGGYGEFRSIELRGRSRGRRRCLVGKLSSPHRFVTVAVELEVVPHSPTRIELGLRPVGPVCLRCHSAYRLFRRLAPALLDALAGEMIIAACVGPEPLVGLPG